MEGSSSRGIEISFAKENTLRAEVAKRAGVLDGSEGFNAAMLGLAYELDYGDRRTASVELLTPRLENINSLLVGIGESGQPKAYFELEFSRLSETAIRELAIYALGAKEMSE